MGQAAQFQVADEVGELAGGIHRNVAARVGAIGPETPDFGQIEHLAHTGSRGKFRKVPVYVELA